jgi:hypothetical protein
MPLKRNRMSSARGCIRRIKRKLHLDCWRLQVTEWVGGKPRMNSYLLGDLSALPTEADARAAADALLRERGTNDSIAEMLKRRFLASRIPNFSIDWYMRTAAEQQNKCAICDRIPKKLVVDHDHEDGQLRGLLCQQCNTAIGMLRDNAVLVRRALLYLEAHGQ